MKKIITILSLVTIIILRLFAPFIFEQSFVKTNYKEMPLKGDESLMIVAHPDDEILWGSTKLLNDDFVVVCITCGTVKTRVLEFESVMNETSDKYIMLGYPDKVNGERSDWKDCYKDIEEDIRNIYELQNWKEIVTHNPDGEYGHQHHKMTSKIVTDVTIDKNKLTYFGKYYSKKKLEGLTEFPPTIGEDALNRKEEILKLYESQKNTIKGLSHMNKYEDYKSYDEWRQLYDEKD